MAIAPANAHNSDMRAAAVARLTVDRKGMTDDRFFTG
jgi:hypothetical protein